MASRCKRSKYQSSLTHGPALPAQPPQGRKRGNVNENQRNIKLENLGNYRPEWIRPGPVDFLTTTRLRAERETMHTALELFAFIFVASVIPALLKGWYDRRALRNAEDRQLRRAISGWIYSAPRDSALGTAKGIIAEMEKK